ncbi:hypothetical protein Pan97_14880 [Bremerella volcania]|uniref:DUF5673 domain-containing protein n=1 Tax=Bremerella volcania TaxID=2527984 RepID=A0A518C5H2_9BACT|nr:hypothetical protein [Bremerella volcania]QDU74480.1 hypothetical protein Pan97_14880 [Bremerella volcania]
MSSDPLGEPELEVLDEKPRQFQLIHLIGVMTALAVLSALFAPALRALKSDQATTALMLLGTQLTVVTAAYFFGMYRRRKALQGSGARLGQSFTGSPITQKLISIFVIAGMLFLSLYILLIAVGNTSGSFKKFPIEAMYLNFLLAAMSVPFLLHIFWKRHLGVVEFFEHGVALTPMKLTPWELVEVQPHQTKQNGIQMTVSRKGKWARKLTIPALVSPELRSYLLRHHSNPDAPSEETPLKKLTLFDP